MEEYLGSTRPMTATNMALSTAPALRKKAGGMRTWLRLDSTSNHNHYTAGKHEIMRLTGLPARDLRILDPLLSYPSTVLGRERAIVINLEHIKAIITAQEVLLLNSKDPSVIPFVEELKKRISYYYHATKAQEGDGGDKSNRKNIADFGEVQSRDVSPVFSGEMSQDGGRVADEKQGLENRDGTKVLPFEFVALEACLEVACSSLENEARTLELEAHPALDKLTSKISTLNLERVRQIKSRLVAITGRVQKVRDELEHLLDDDEDMAEMYLTDKLAEHLENSSASSMTDQDDINFEVIPSEDDMYLSNKSDPHLTTNAAEIAVEAQALPEKYEGANNNQDHLYRASSALTRDSHGTHTSTTRSAIDKNLDVEELEMLLEAYFVQIEGTLNKLSTLREYVDDTEDYINIMLDDKQNHLLQMGVMLTTATLVVSAFVVVAGIFGMNIHIDLFEGENTKPAFIWTVAGSTTGTIFLYIFAIAWCRYKRLLE